MRNAVAIWWRRGSNRRFVARKPRDTDSDRPAATSTNRARNLDFRMTGHSIGIVKSQLAPGRFPITPSIVNDPA